MVFRSIIVSLIDFKARNPNYLSKSICTFLDLGNVLMTEQHGFDKLLSLEANSLCGPDGIRSLFLWKCSSAFCESLCRVFNNFTKILEDVTFNSHLKIGILCLIIEKFAFHQLCQIVRIYSIRGIIFLYRTICC